MRPPRPWPLGAALATAALIAGLAVPGCAPGIRAQPVVTGLDRPVSFVLTPGGQILYGELRTGRIMRYNPATRSKTVFFTVPNVVAEGEQGLLGLALHPDYPSKPYVYAYVTRRVAAGLENHVVRVTQEAGRGVSMRVIFRARAAIRHNGGRILFGPDRRLYVLIGENGVPARSQDLRLTLGKILRMTDTGGIPGDNPFSGSYVFAYGIRNGFGMSFDPRTGRLWETENGPDCNDEVNLIVRGGNFGWGPRQTCQGLAPRNTNQDGPNPILPKSYYTPPVAPTGVAFCERCGLGASANGKLFYGRLNTREVRRVALGQDRFNVTAESTVVRLDESILSVEVGPDNAIYFSTFSKIYKLVSS